MPLRIGVAAYVMNVASPSAFDGLIDSELGGIKRDMAIGVIGRNGRGN